MTFQSIAPRWTVRPPPSYQHQQLTLGLLPRRPIPPILFHSLRRAVRLPLSKQHRQLTYGLLPCPQIYLLIQSGSILCLRTLDWNSVPRSLVQTSLFLKTQLLLTTLLNWMELPLFPPLSTATATNNGKQTLPATILRTMTTEIATGRVAVIAITTGTATATATITALLTTTVTQ